MTVHRSTGDGSPPESTAPPSPSRRQPSLSRRALLAGSAAGLASLAGCAGGDAGIVAGKRDESTATFDLDEGALRVDADHGNVTVRESDGGVRVRTVKSGSLLSTLSAVTVTAERDGDAVVVRSRADGDPWFLASMPRVSIDIEIPSGVSVETMNARNGNARVEDVAVSDGTAIRTRNGNAIARRVDGDLAVETDNGNAEARNVAGFVSGRSENGNVTVSDCDGVGDVVTKNGNASADVTAIREDTRIQSVNGNVHAALSGDLDARVTARTENGNVTVDGDLPIDRKGRTYAEGTLGEGTNDLRLQTTNGNVSLSRRS